MADFVEDASVNGDDHADADEEPMPPEANLDGATPAMSPGSGPSVNDMEQIQPMSLQELETELNRCKQIEEEAKARYTLAKKHNGELKKRNEYLKLENQRLRDQIDSKRKRKQQMSIPASMADCYDWVCDITMLGDVSKEGWKVKYSETFINNISEEDKNIALSGQGAGGLGSGWDGAVVAVLGLFDKGKTFVLNHLTQTNLPSGKKVSTKGLSFKHVDVDQTKFIILDSEGSYSPVKVVNDLSVVEKETTELFLGEVIFELADYFLCVVNDFTSLDQRYLDKLTRNLQNSKKAFREVIVVHNCKDIIEPEVLAHIWETQVTRIYGNGTLQNTKVAAINKVTGLLEESNVQWFKTQFTRHICLANEDSPLGEEMNPWAFSLLRYWLKGVFVPVNRKFSVIESVVHYCNLKLSNYFKNHPKLTLMSTDNPAEKFIRSVDVKEEMRLPQVSIDASGLMLTRPDSFMPAVDIIKDKHAYSIYLDVPGLTKRDCKLSRQNVVTIIKGGREIPYAEKLVRVEKAERKYGDFTMTFKIPEDYERKWSSCSVENGVLKMVFRADADEEDVAMEDAEGSD